MNRQKIGLLILRFSMAGLYIWFGFNQIYNTSSWENLVPDWATSLFSLTASNIILANGLFEIFLGILLALGIFIGPVSILLSLHLFVIAFEFGISPTGIRDASLALATLSIFFLGDR